MMPQTTAQKKKAFGRDTCLIFCNFLVHQEAVVSIENCLCFST